MGKIKSAQFDFTYVQCSEGCAHLQCALASCPPAGPSLRCHPSQPRFHRRPWGPNPSRFLVQRFRPLSLVQLARTPGTPVCFPSAPACLTPTARWRQGPIFSGEAWNSSAVRENRGRGKSRLPRSNTASRPELQTWLSFCRFHRSHSRSNAIHQDRWRDWLPPGQAPTKDEKNWWTDGVTEPRTRRKDDTTVDYRWEKGWIQMCKPCGDLQRWNGGYCSNMKLKRHFLEPHWYQNVVDGSCCTSRTRESLPLHKLV
jgi:hypothetical protein